MLKNLFKQHWPIFGFLGVFIIGQVVFYIFYPKQDPSLTHIKEQQETLIKINAELVANSTEWQRLEEAQKKLTASSDTLRKQRDELESQIATEMGLGTGGKATTPTTTMSWSAQGKPELN